MGGDGEREQRRLRKLTPLESELRADLAEPPRPLAPPRRGPLRRLRDRQRRRRPPRTLAGAIALGLLRFGIGLASGTAAALLLARLLGRPASVGFYVLGAGILSATLVGARTSRQRMAYDYGESGRPPRTRPGMVMVAVGILLILTGAILETV